VSTVVSVSAPVGGGKSSLVRGLAQRMNGAAIYFDSYETLTERPHQEIQRWMADGAEVDELVIEGLAEDLARLKAGEPVTDPANGVTVAPAEFIFYETPFARQHQATGSLIDLSIWIDTPLDVAMARNLSEFLSRPEMRNDLHRWLGPYLENYLGWVRDLLLMQQQMVGGNADLVLDGLATLDDNVARAADEVARRFA
jgi:uridine kinase